MIMPDGRIYSGVVTSEEGQKKRIKQQRNATASASPQLDKPATPAAELIPKGSFSP